MVKMHCEVMHKIRNIKDCCEVQGWIREYEKKVKKQDDLKCSCECCVKIWNWLNEKWGHAWENRNKRYIYNCYNVQKRMKRSERNVKRQKDVNYSNTGWVKRLSGKKELLSHAED